MFVTGSRQDTPRAYPTPGTSVQSMARWDGVGAFWVGIPLLPEPALAHTPRRGSGGPAQSSPQVSDKRLEG